jgi:exonuclease SbcC
LELKQKDHEICVNALERLKKEQELTRETLDRDTQALEEVRLQIVNAAGSAEPQAVARRVEEEIAWLENNYAEARQAEQHASQHLRDAQQQLEFCEREASFASTQSGCAQEAASAALQATAFTDAAEARAAYRYVQEMQAIHCRVAEYDATVCALSRRLSELEVMLHGRRITAEECASAEQEYKRCLQRLNAAEKEAALLSQQANDIRERLDRVRRLREEASEGRRLHQIYDWLARDLRTDRFQAYLLEETLTGLVNDASEQLGRLTGDRYGLTFTDDRILVLDNDNAGECRGVETLSGGETFLASLSLALALSAQVQAAAGAVRLDCLFIDEGFGTLDPETLRTVSDAIRGLQVGGRMVGIITHVPELKEEFDQRLIVERSSAGSQVRPEMG